MNDIEQAIDRLASRPGFERDPDDPAHLTWYGIRMPKIQPNGVLSEPQRWVRGTLRVDAGQIVADVDSDKHLARLLDVLSKVGADPLVTHEKRIDPAKEFVWSGGSLVRPRGPAPSGEGWEKLWLDEHLPALGGRTPREATEGKEGLMLEALLRQFEYESDLLTAQGQPGIDTDWMRQELGFADDPVEEAPAQRNQAQSSQD